MMIEGKQAIKEAILRAKNIGLIAHKKGDGDSFGSMIALKLTLDKLGKNSVVFSEEGLPDDLEFLYQYFNFKFLEEYQPGLDLLITIDCSEVAITSLPELVRQYQNEGTKIAQLDHHQRGKFYEVSDVKWVSPEYCSVAEMTYALINDLNVEIDKNMATMLLTGINTDTSSFQNQNTSESCLAISSDLMLHGARLGFINRKINSATSINKLKLLGLAFNRLSFSGKYKAAISYLTYEDAINVGLEPKDISGVVNTLNQIKGAKMVVFFSEQEPGTIQVSLRTRDKDVDVAKIAQFLGGGGHIKAAGFTFPGTIQKTDGKITINS